MSNDDAEPDDESRMTTLQEPTTDDRRRAVCAAMGRAPSLVRFAARYTGSIDDAEDVYQRSMEIALTKAPTVEPDAFLAWLYTVIRNEAFSVLQDRRRESLGRREDVAATESAASESSSPEHIAEWRERHRGVRDALDSLSEQQRTCVMLQSTGLTYDQIASVTGFTRRQIERSIMRGRRRLSIWEDKLESGAACEQLRPTLDRIVQGDATERERKRAAKHTAACTACRASLVRSRAMRQTLSGLVPVTILAGIDQEAIPPDPGIAIDLGERVALSTAARVAQLAGPLGELPFAGAGRVAAGVGALVVACLATIPLLGGSPSPDRPLAPSEPALAVTFGPAAPTSAARRLAAAAVPLKKSRRVRKTRVANPIREKTAKQPRQERPQSSPAAASPPTPSARRTAAPRAATRPPSSARAEFSP